MHVLLKARFVPVPVDPSKRKMKNSLIRHLLPVCPNLTFSKSSLIFFTGAWLLT